MDKREENLKGGDKYVALWIPCMSYTSKNIKKIVQKQQI